MLELAVLGLLNDSGLHGYELKKRLTELLGPWSSVSFGSLYPALARLERDGELIAAESGASAPAPVAELTPMSGSLGAELAAYRNRADTRRTPARVVGGRRAKKVYAITDAGRERLAVLLDDAGGDDRTFAVRVGFCGHLDPEVRLALFHRRRAEILVRLAERASNQPATAGSADPYRRSMREFHDDRLQRELAWLDQLIAGEHADPDSPHVPDLIPNGGSPS